MVGAGWLVLCGMERRRCQCSDALMLWCVSAHVGFMWCVRSRCSAVQFFFLLRVFPAVTRVQCTLIAYLCCCIYRLCPRFSLISCMCIHSPVQEVTFAKEAGRGLRLTYLLPRWYESLNERERKLESEYCKCTSVRQCNIRYIKLSWMNLRSWVLEQTKERSRWR